MRRILEKFRIAKKWFFDALLPPQCIFCGMENTFLCDTHRKFLPAPPQSPPPFLDEIFAAVQYHHFVAEKVVQKFKYDGFRDIAAICADEIAKKIPAEIFKNAVLFPIPLFWTRKFWRGFNQSEILAREIQQKFPAAKISKKLIRRKKTVQQAKLKNKFEREKNLRDAFFWPKNLPVPPKIILVDDVAATGATLSAAAKILRDAGAQKIFGLVFARS